MIFVSFIAVLAVSAILTARLRKRKSSSKQRLESGNDRRQVQSPEEEPTAPEPEEPAEEEPVAPEPEEPEEPPEKVRIFWLWLDSNPNRAILWSK